MRAHDNITLIRSGQDRVDTGPEERELRLHHEVSVFDAHDKHYEYVDCHPATGMLRDATAPATT